MKFKIAKDFSFCFGHRVWTQVLDPEFADDLMCACRHLHGHEAKVTVCLTSKDLTDGMVTDFRHLEWLKRFLDRTLDHKFVIDLEDPMLDFMTKGRPQLPVHLDDRLVGYTLDLEGTEGAEREYLESFFMVSFVPTSENFSMWLFNIVDYKMEKLGVKVANLEWWESSKSRSICIGDKND